MHRVLIVAFLSINITLASAQVPGDVISIFGGIMQSAIAQGVRNEWMKLPSPEIACVDQTLRARGASLQALVVQGIGPSDGRVIDLRRACQARIATAVSGQPPDRAVYVVANTLPPDPFLSLRSDPSAEYGQRLSKLRNGTRLQVLQRRSDGWWQVRVIETQEVGWAFSGRGNTQWIVCCESPTNATASNAQPTQPIQSTQPIHQPTVSTTAPVVQTPNPVTAPTANVEAPLTDCDTFAGNPFEPGKKAPGLAFDKINANVAVPACMDAANQYPNSARILFQLGRAYHRQGNFQGALSYYQRAVALGSVSAMNGLGVLYLNGSGVPQDYARAYAWAKKAADAGSINSHALLGFMYASGRGVTKDEVEAFRLFRVAAEQGDPVSQGAVGIAYAKGAGTNQNLDEAVIWLQRAADQGNDSARKQLAEIEDAKLKKAEVDANAKKQAEALEEIRGCERLAGAKTYLIASCALQGMQRSNQTEGLKTAKDAADESSKGLACSAAAIDNLRNKADRLAAKILSSSAISPLMDFSSAIDLECRKAADSNLERAN